MPSSTLFPKLSSFLTTYFSESDASLDASSVKRFLGTASSDEQTQVLLQAKNFLEKGNLQEALGMMANRWFGDEEEAKTWFSDILKLLSEGSDLDAAPVKDSNGALLEEGDAVTVIKDLKVKGGSSDLKRGTLIKKIHLIGDPENIECNVGGSTLVLKTCFLKKA